jgi:hypothetical protein
MNAIRKSQKNPLSGEKSGEMFDCRTAAMLRYCQLFGNGQFPALREESPNTYRVYIPDTEQK